MKAKFMHIVLPIGAGIAGFAFARILAILALSLVLNACVTIHITEPEEAASDSLGEDSLPVAQVCPQDKGECLYGLFYFTKCGVMERSPARDYFCAEYYDESAQ